MPARAITVEPFAAAASLRAAGSQAWRWRWSDPTAAARVQRW